MEHSTGPGRGFTHTKRSAGAFVWRLIPLLIGLLGCSDPAPKSETANAGTTAKPDSAELVFRKVTEEAGLGDFRHVTGAYGQKLLPETFGAGGAFLDYNGDGWQDILLVRGARWPHRTDRRIAALWLYRNDGNGSFTNVTRESGLEGLYAYGMGVTAGDIDNDGDPDVLLTAVQQDHLLENRNGRFVDVTAESVLADDTTWSTAATLFDADRDGNLDLYLGKYVRWSVETDIGCSLDGEHLSYCTPELYEGISGRFFVNRGDGSFVDRTTEAGFTNKPGKTLGVVPMDYNGDGWTDLYVANDTRRNLLFENQGDGTFSERGTLAGIAVDERGKPRSGMGIDAGIVDHTGEPTVFVGNFSEEVITAYRHERRGIFSNRAGVSGVGPAGYDQVTFGLILEDFDLDGDLDLLAANGHIQAQVEATGTDQHYRQAPLLLLNDGDGQFQRPANVAGGLLTDSIVGRGLATADFDLDGDLDILMTENGGPVHLWRNDSEGGAFLRVTLEGRKSNRDGIGSEIHLWSDGRKMVRRVRTGTSYLTQSDLSATFGLGSETEIDSIRIDWSSGETDRFHDLPSNSWIRFTEGRKNWERIAMPASELASLH